MKAGSIMRIRVTPEEVRIVADIQAEIEKWRRIRVSEAEVIRTALRAYHADYIEPYKDRPPPDPRARTRNLWERFWERFMVYGEVKI